MTQLSTSWTPTSGDDYDQSATAGFADLFGLVSVRQFGEISALPVM